MSVLKTLIGMPDLPSQNFLLQVKEMLKYTPDAAKLEEKKFHYMFVYGDMKRGHRRLEMLGGAEFYGQGFTKSAFSMWKKNLGKETFPIPFTDRDGATPFCKIRGEVFAVPTDVIKELDKHWENGVQFIRKRVRISIPHRIQVMDSNAKVVHTSRTRDQTLAPFMYVGVQDYWNELINGIQFGKVTTRDYGEHFTIMDALKEASKFYDFAYKDYFDEKPLSVPKRTLTPLRYDDVGNLLETAAEIKAWEAKLKASSK